MCELFGVSSRKKLYLNSFLKEFFSDSCTHQDGWGLCRFREGTAIIEKEPLAANMSDYLRYRLSEDIIEDVLIAHIRRASVGRLSYANSHPFELCDRTGRCWVLAHNGTLFDSHGLDTYKKVQKGTTDSERILYCLLNRLDQKASALGRSLSSGERFDVADSLISEITPSNKVNVLVYDGDLLYVHSNSPCSLFWKKEDGSVMICTRALEENGWEEVPLNIPFAFKDGVMLMQGTDHCNTHYKTDAEVYIQKNNYMNI